MSDAPVALVTGAARRVGQAIAVRLAGDGFTVVVHHHGTPADETLAAIRAVGGRGIALAADLADPEACAPLIDRVVAACGRLDALVHSAANWVRAPWGRLAADDLDRSVATNLRAPMLLSQAAAPHLAARQGAIVHLADHLAYDWEPASLAHGVVKGAVEHLTRGLATLLAPDVRVNAVAPGVVLLPEGTPDAVAARLAAETPLGRLGAAEDVADAVRWLLRARYVTGEVLHVDGGRHLRR